MALELGLVENQDFGMINDACLTELTPELFIEKSLKKITNAWSNFLDLSRILMKTVKEDALLEMQENCLQQFFVEHRYKNAPSLRFLYLHRFKPLKDEVAHSISKKYQLYKE